MLKHEVLSYPLGLGHLSHQSWVSGDLWTCPEYGRVHDWRNFTLYDCTAVDENFNQESVSFYNKYSGRFGCN